MNLNKLHYFFVVAKQGSVKAASQSLNLTQPTISAQIKQLEEGLGFDLFFRKHRKLELTRNGRYVLAEAEKLFAIVDNIEASLPDRGKAERQQIRVGALHALSSAFIYDFSLKLWRDETVMISVTESNYQDLFQKLAKNELDIVLSDSEHRQSKRYTSTLLNTDTAVLVAHAKLGLSKETSYQELSDRPYLRLSNMGRFQQDVDYFFERQGIELDVLGEVDDFSLLRKIVENTPCFSIVPKRSVIDVKKSQNLKVIKEIRRIRLAVWAVTSSSGANRPSLQRLISDYFLRQTKS